MTAWIEDAQTLTHAKDLNQSEKSLLQRTSDVENYLSDDTPASNALVAPKGFGKTFILKLKRIAVQQDGYHCLPHDHIVDRPQNPPPSLSHEILDLLSRSSYWESLWQIAFTIALLKAYRTDTDATALLEDIRQRVKGNSCFEDIISDSHIDTSFGVIHNCLRARRNEFLDLFDKAQFTTAAYSRLNRRAAIFIDNIDEYLEDYIRHDRSGRDGNQKLYLKLWHNGQIGAWRAIRRLQGVNPHIKIYISLRKEAYQYANSHEALFANLRAFSRELHYSLSDIKEIIEKNISNESASKLADKTAATPILQFVGADNEFVSNSGTGKYEPTLSYWMRHCTGRPRDAVTIGNEISKIPVERRNLSAIRSAINNTAAARVQVLFNEVAPFFDGFHPDLLAKVLKSNVLSRDDVEKAAQDYGELAAKEHGYVSDSTIHPFCALYAIGLIGVVVEDRDRPGMIQTFSAVGAVPFGTTGVLPHAEIYLVHPSLSDYIALKNVTYLSNLNRLNVVGDKLEWRPEEEVRFVAIGDMRGFREKIMESVSGSQTFGPYWKKVFARHTKGLELAQASGGDSMLLADRSPIRLFRSLRALTSTLRKSKYEMRMRVAGHSGHWRINLDQEGGVNPEISDVVGIAARLEPLGKPGSMIVTQTFIDDAQRINKGHALKGITPRPVVVADVSNKSIFNAKKGLLISKKGKEKEQRFKCFIIEDIDLGH